MSYVKHTWVNNEVISASKLNNIEDGIEEASQSGGGVVIVTLENGYLDKNFNELKAAFMSGKEVIRLDSYTLSEGTNVEKWSLQSIYENVDNNYYTCTFRFGDITTNFEASSLTDNMSVIANQVAS